ncbi:MAG: glycoside hydrolase family 57 protein [Methylacidiphilales bacterium]|nr:glycoside hydrolase family 57 protein [Candidatus Methylacidiphilales bacterium]
MINVLFLWHMHQPYYVDPLTRTALMPWVRLHAAKGYLDMIDLAGRYPELRLNFNFTPVLVRQLQELAGREVSDLWEDWSRKPASALETEDKKNILVNFFKINCATCIEPHPRYLQLLELRGRQYNPASLAESAALFTEQDYRDLQVWYNLVWCGFSACKRYPELAELKRKGRDFTEAEKLRVLDIHREIISQVLGLYREAQEEHRVEITTTPFFHPIMPLVYDTDFATRCMPGRELPPRFSAPEDVRAQLRLAQELHEKTFGRRARGLWPSEGSVAPELLPLFAEAGIEYFCTDEEVLFRSLALDPVHNSRKVNHLELFQGWEFECMGARVKGMFRERPLSDFIGFNSARNSARDSADYLVHHLEHLADVVPEKSGAVLLALDGENAWEAFADGGEQFLSTFYEGILRSGKLAVRRLGDYFDEAGDCPKASALHTGSWIHGDFDIWIGDPEENRAWEWLAKTREFLVQAISQGLDEKKRAEAWLEIYAAEGSDWFWWYGPDFQNDSDLLFDGLFRKHLQNVYRLAGVPVPQHLEVPIRQRGVQSAYVKPASYIHPVLNGRDGGYYDWLGSGYLDVRQQQTAMFQSGRAGKAIYFGFNETDFFFRFDYEETPPDGLVLVFCKPAHNRVVIERKDRDYQARVEASDDGVRFNPVATAVKVRHGARIEMSMPLAALGVVAADVPVAFQVRVLKDGVELERYPERGLIEFKGPSPQFGLHNWFI